MGFKCDTPVHFSSLVEIQFAEMDHAQIFKTLRAIDRQLWTVCGSLTSKFSRLLRMDSMYSKRLARLKTLSITPRSLGHYVELLPCLIYVLFGFILAGLQCGKVVMYDVTAVDLILKA